MTTTVDPGRARAAAGSRYFYVWIACVCVATAFLGFAPTYWVPLAHGAFKANPIVHIHGLVFFSWTMFFVFQSWLVASGRTVSHRDIGLIGVSLATAMTMLGFLVAIESAQRAISIGMGDAGKAFMIVPISGIVTFAILVGFAISNVRKPEIHKRLLLIATASILDAAVARWFLTFLAPPNASPVPPVAIALPAALIVDLIVVAGMVHDWRTRGRPHPVYLIAGGAVLAEQLFRVPLSATPAWRAVATWLIGVMG